MDKKPPQVPTEDVARNRLMQLTLVRLIGLFFTIPGLWLTGQAGAMNSTMILGLIALAVGALISLFASKILKFWWNK